MNFFKTSFLSGIRTVIAMTARLVVNKIIALKLGAESFTILGQFRDILQIGLKISNLGFEKGLIKEVSQHRKDERKLATILSTAFLAQLIVTGIFSLLLVLFQGTITIWLIGDNQYDFVLGLMAIGFLPQVIFSTVMAVLNGLKQFKRFVAISIIINLLTAIANIALIYYFQLEGALYGMLSQLFVSFFGLLFFFGKSGIKVNWFLQKFSHIEFKNLLQFSAMFVSGAVSLSICLIGVRIYLTDTYNLEYTGYWEALWRISKVYVTFLISTFSLYILPTFSEISVKYLRREIFKIWRITIPLTLLASLSLYFFRDFAITLIYSKEFLVISSLIAIQLLGDTIKLNSMVLGNVLIAKSHTKVFIAVQLCWALIFYGGIRLFVPLYGFKGVAIAYLVSYILHFLFMNIYFRKLLWKGKSIRI